MSYIKKTHRFGLLTPSSNTTQEPEFSAALPPSVSLHTGRVAYRDITPEEQMRCVLELESESRKLADAEVDRRLARLDPADQVGEARERRARIDGRASWGGVLRFGLAGYADHDTLTSAAGRSAARSLKIGTIGEARLRRD